MVKVNIFTFPPFPTPLFHLSFCLGFTLDRQMWYHCAISPALSFYFMQLILSIYSFEVFFENTDHELI